jgi:hypothetical protein
MMSAIHLVPDLAAEIYVLDGLPVQREGMSREVSAAKRKTSQPGTPADPMTGMRPFWVDLTELDGVVDTMMDLPEIGD